MHTAQIITLRTQRLISAPQRTTSIVLAAAVYACSSANITSGPACFSSAQCSGSLPYCARGDEEQRQHSTQAGRQAGAPLL